MFALILLVLHLVGIIAWISDMQCASAPYGHFSNLADMRSWWSVNRDEFFFRLFVPVHSGLSFPAMLHNCSKRTNLHSVVSPTSLRRHMKFDPVSGRWHRGSTLSAVRFVVTAVVSSGSIEGQKSIEDRAAWTKAVRKKHVDFQYKKNEYWTERVNNERAFHTIKIVAINDVDHLP